MGKRFASFAAIGTFVILSLVIVFFIIYTDSNSTCTSIECVQSASELLTHLDPSVSPCSDFYEFTCGHFLKSLTENESHNSLSDYSRRSKTNQIRQMIGEPSNVYDTKTLSKIKSFYIACMNESAINNNSIKGMKGILRDIGGWPLFERGNWRESDFDWKIATFQLRKIGIDFDAFISLDIFINANDRTKHVIALQPGRLENYLSNFNNDKVKYLAYMVDVAVYFGCDRNRAEHEFKEVIEFQSQLKKIQNKYPRKNFDYEEYFNPKTLYQLQQNYPTVYWIDYINRVLLHPNIGVSADEIVNVVDVEYIAEFLQLLNKTPRRILANFISWYVIELHMPYMPKDLRNKIEIYQEKNDRIVRSEFCVDVVQNKMSQAVEECYVKKYVSDGAKRLTKDIIDAIKKEFNKIMNDLDWLDDVAKDVAREKLASTKDYIAYTPEAPSRRKFDLIYDEIKVRKDNFLLFLLDIEFINLKLKYEKLIEPVYENEANQLSYSVKQNILLLPSYYLQGLFFNEHRPQYMNYGAIGTIIAYQLSNLFLEGRRYDLYGNLREWSTSHSLYNYDTRARCISEQLMDLHIPGFRKNINATRAQDDDVAINFGKKIAYRAYLEWAQQRDNEQSLPGLTYTPRQLFWIASAMYECTKGDDQNVVVGANEMWNRHRSIPRLRVVGALRNSKEFAEDFNCPANAFMNPSDKCALW